ncbi:MAG TPA: hypothetical protein PKL48_14180, partial [Thermodesulfobacteriota bacterium]|nr:hypothetical protein [Thermodesulfobacteriota bacterium]
PHICTMVKILDPRFRGNDILLLRPTFYESIKINDLTKKVSNYGKPFSCKHPGDRGASNTSPRLLKQQK